MMKLSRTFGIGAVFAGALALAAVSGAPRPAQAASKTGNFFLGLATGIAATAVIASAAHASKRRRRVYYRRPHPAPWTPAWYDYCAARYRSFNPETGYYRTYSGRYRFCR